MLINSKTGVFLTGRVTKDPKTKQTANSSVTKFSILYGYSSEKDENDHRQGKFMDVDVWGKAGEDLTSVIQKGDHLAVSGELRQREYEGKTYYSVSAQEIFPDLSVILAIVPESAEEGCNSGEVTHDVPSSAEFDTLDDDGDLPF
jgi:single stranded DNA-binding protein